LIYNAYVKKYSYQEFCDYVRRFNQEELLVTVARMALELPDNAAAPGYTQTPPWALAAVVKASICHGNPHRSTSVSPRDIVTACHMYNNPSDEEIQQIHVDPLSSFLGRTAYEQFPYQESSPFVDMTRPLCVLTIIQAARTSRWSPRMQSASAQGRVLGVPFLLPGTGHAARFRRHDLNITGMAAHFSVQAARQDSLASALASAPPVRL
jgi:hypothetical protein